MQTQTAKLNYLRIAPRKTRSVADLVRGLSVNDAEAQLMVQSRRPAKSALLSPTQGQSLPRRSRRRWSSSPSPPAQRPTVR